MWLLIGGAVALVLWVAVGLDDGRAAREARRDRATRPVCKHVNGPHHGHASRSTIPRQRQGGDR